MDQKLQNLFYSLPSRTAWIIIGSCAAYWLICLTGILTPPVTAPADIVIFWFYAMLMLALASGVAAIAAGGLLLMRRQGGAFVPVAAQSGTAEADDDDGGQDQLAGLGRMLDGPGNPAPSEWAAVTGKQPQGRPQEQVLTPPSPPVPPRKAPKRKPRKRRR